LYNRSVTEANFFWSLSDVLLFPLEGGFGTAGSLTKVTLDELSSSVDDDELLILFLCLKFLLSLSCSASVVKSV